MFGSGQILRLNQFNLYVKWTDHHMEQYIVNQETVNASSRRIPKYNSMVMHIVKLKTSNMKFKSTR